MRERIEKILHDKGLTQAEFADLINVNRSSITHIMTGRNKSSDTVVARTLLTFPDINPNWLSAGEGEMYLEHVYVPPRPNVSESDTGKDEHFGGLFDTYIPENKDITEHVEQKNPFWESHIQPPAEHAPAVSKHQDVVAPVERKENLISPEEKKIRKIVFFYADKTFEEYYPEK
jgi:transcriptional regulator with XRE-family HTH domain